MLLDHRVGTYCSWQPQKEEKERKEAGSYSAQDVSSLILKKKKMRHMKTRILQKICNNVSFVRLLGQGKGRGRNRRINSDSAMCARDPWLVCVFTIFVIRKID